MINYNGFSDDEIISAARNVSLTPSGKVRNFSINEIYIELGFVPGKSPSWHNRESVITGSKIVNVLIANGLQIDKSRKPRPNIRRYSLSSKFIGGLC